MKRLLSLIASCSLLLFGCRENEALYYEGEPDGTSGIYFAYYSGMTMGSSITYHYKDTTADNSLTNVAGSSAVVGVPVRVFGNISEQDRPFKVKVIGGTVKEGEDFTLPEEFVIPGGAASASVPVTIFKKDELQDGVVRYITIGLEENEYFKPYIDKRLVGNDTINVQTITIRYSMVFEEPWNWGGTSNLNNWGAYSHAKLNFMLSVMGWTYREFTSKNFVYVGPTICILTQAELQKRADAGDPVRELDGSLMQLGPKFLVDYSAYE
ncbi:MAG: DUF4843 domain-containing protein [Odoribacter sp.]|nr:DUF4843 domain-containing protein [Odoribacter sp.]